MARKTLHIIYEDNHLLAVEKPAGLATMGVGDDKPTLLNLAKDYIKQKYNKPGNVYLGIVSRLDALVTGVALFARTSKAAARLSEQFRTRTVEKLYIALVASIVEPPFGQFEDYLAKDEPHKCMKIAKSTAKDAKLAKLTYQRLKTVRGHSLVEVKLESGRKHQIRLQFADHGHPIVGDAKYGSRETFPSGIALHARRLVITHPVKDVPIVLESPLPTAWHTWGIKLD